MASAEFNEVQWFTDKRVNEVVICGILNEVVFVLLQMTQDHSQNVEVVPVTQC